MHNGSNHNGENAATDLARLLAADGATGGFIKDAQAGSLPATATNDNATAGTVGEIIESTVLVAAKVSLASSGTAYDITSISLTAGDWDVWGSVSFAPNAATTITAFAAAINTTSATLPTAPNGGAYSLLAAASFATGTAAHMPTGTRRMSLSGTTTVYLIGLSNFAVNVMDAYGYIGARRVR